MSDERSFERTARAWLEQGANQAPDRAVQAVLLAIETTPQERDLRIPWRFPTMNTPLRVGIAAVFGLLLLGAGIYFVGGSSPGVGGKPPATVSPTPAPTTATPSSITSSPVANLTPGQLCAGSSPCLSGAMLPGMYWFDGPGVMPEGRLTFTVPAGWTSTDGLVVKSGDVPEGLTYSPTEVLLSTWIVSHVYADACQWEGTLVEAGTTIDEIANRLASQKNRVATAVEDVTLGGMPAKRIELTVPADLDVTTCHGDGGYVRFWPKPGPDESGGFCCVAPGAKDTVYVVDLGGEPFVVDVTEGPEASTVDRAELRSIVESIVITPPEASPSAPGASPSP